MRARHVTAKSIVLAVRASTLALIVATTSAWAQPASPGPAAAVVADQQDIVVTARNREESLRDVPLAITAITAAQLGSTGVRDLRDISQLTPGLTVIDAGAQFYTTPTIRGLAQLNIQNGAIENNVSVFLNGVYLQNAGAINLSLLNLERVEVVKGPVSSLYGRSAFAGAINYVSKRPSDTLTATIDGTVGTHHRYAGSALISGPLGEGLRATIGGVYDSFGGTWQDPVNGNDAGGYKKRDVFLAVEGDLGADTRVTINGYYGKDRFDPPAEYHLANNCAPNAFGVLQQYCGKIREGKVIEVPDAYASGASGNDREVKHADARLESKLGDFTASLIAGYNNLHTRQFLEINNRRDGLTYPLVPGPGTINLNEYYGDDNRSEDYSFEGRIASPQYDRLRFSAGAFYYHSSGSQISNITLNSSLLPSGQTSINNFLARLWLTPGAAPTSPNRNFARTRGEQYSGFAEGEFKFTDALSFAQEIRYTDETKNIQVLQSAVAPGATFAPLKADYNYWNSRSTLRYKPSDDLMLYASAANGTKSGGFNGRASFPGDQAYDPEKNWTYEAGVKGAALDRVVTYEIAVYHIDAKNLQVLGPNSDPNNPGQVVKNYGGARNTGFEIQTTTALGDRAHFNLGFAYNDPKFKKGSVDAQYAGICAALASCAPSLVTFAGQRVIDIRGNSLPRQSRYQITSSIDAHADLAADWSLSGLVKYSFQSKQFYEPANFSHYGPTHNLGARATLSKGGLSATAWVENILNQTQAYSAFYNIRITDFIFETLPLYNDKRTAGVTLSYRY